MNQLTKLLRNYQIRSLTLKANRFLHTQKQSTNSPSVKVLIGNVNNSWIWQKNDPIKQPETQINKIELPNGLVWIPPLEEPELNKIIEAPSNSDDAPKEAARLILIRRKKMKKHKLKKLRKKMKFEWAKRRQRRELRKEKLFQAGLIKQYKIAEAFSAEAYVQEKLDKLKEEVIPPKPPKVYYDHFDLSRTKK